jgi:hypothetical protein
MIVLSDNDILFKLAHCDLFDEFLAYIQLPVKSIAILHTCIFKMRKTLRSHPEVLARLERFCQLVTIIADDEVNIDVLEAIMETGADSGEAILAAKVAMTPGAYLVTGDKRAVRALNTMADGPIKSALAGRVLCFEELVIGLVHNSDFSELSTKLIAGSACDGVLRNAFGPGRTEEHALACLYSYADELRTACPTLLTPRPVAR